MPDTTGPEESFDAHVSPRRYLSARWQIAKFKEKDPDPFAKDIYFGARKIEKDPVTGVLPPAVDAGEIEFKNRVEHTLSVLKAIYRPVEHAAARKTLGGLIERLASPVDRRSKAWREEREARFNEAFERLFSLTVLGLGTDDADGTTVGKLGIASGALESLRADVLRREAGPIKNSYMKKLGYPALFAGVVFLLLFLLYEKSPGFFAAVCGARSWYPSFFCPATGAESFGALFPSEIYQFRHLFVLMAGCMMGTWASFAARKVTLTFDDLAELEQDRLSPPMRLTFTGTLTFIFALTFLTGMVQIEIGGFRTADLASNGLVALLAGAFFGLLEQSLPTAIMERARNFSDSIGTKA
jgi:hypothetical protein